MMVTRRAILSLVLIFSFALVFLTNVRVVKADNEIRIRADGGVDGTDKIKRDGDVYTFTGDIGVDEWSYGIVIQKDNIVVDGAGHLLKGHGEHGWLSSYPDIHGITLEKRNNVTIKNLRISGFSSGFLGNCSNVKIVGNTLTDNAAGIFFLGSYTNTISGNKITSGGGTGIYLNYCFNSTFSGNVIADCYVGMKFGYICCNNTVSGNVVKGNLEIGIYVRSSSNYNNFTGNSLTGNHEGLVITDTSNNIVSGNNISNNDRGIDLGKAYNNTVSWNILTSNSEYGLSLTGQAENNVIFENNIADNEKGIMMFKESSSNSIYRNNFNNNLNVYDRGVDSGNSPPSINIWDNGTEGNYWSSYNGTDSNEDGLGDTPYIIDENNQDNYPLMEPVEIPKFHYGIDETGAFLTLLVIAVTATIVTVAATCLVVFYFKKRRQKA